MDDLSDAAKVEEVTPRRVAFLRAPFLRDAAEGTDVPGCDEEISIELARRNGLIERRRGRGECRREVLRKRVGIRERAAVLPMA